MTGNTLAGQWDILAVGFLGRKEDRAAAFLRRRQFAIFVPRHSGRRQRLDKSGQVAQFPRGERFRAHEHLGKPGAALNFECGVFSIPFERGRAGDALETAIVEQVIADAISIEVVAKAVHMAVGVA